MSVSGGSQVWIAGWLTEKSGSSVSTSSGSNSSTSNNTGSNTSSTNQNPTTSSMVGKTVTVTGSTVNLRANASTTAAVIAQANQGDTFTVQAEKTVSGDTWYQVTAPSGVKVWIAGWLTKGNDQQLRQYDHQYNRYGKL